MKRLYLFLALLIAPVLALSQAAPPMCIPTVNGYPMELFPRVHQTSTSCHLYYLCQNKAGTSGEVAGVSWPKSALPCTADAMMAVLWPKALEVQAASAKVGTAHRLWRAGVAFGCDDPRVHGENSDRGRMCRERNSVFVANRASWWTLPAGAEWRP